MRHRGFSICIRSDFNDFVNRLTHCLLDRIALRHRTLAVKGNIHRVLDLTGLALLNNLRLTGFQIGVDPHFNLIRCAFTPLNRGRCRLSLRSDLDDVFYRLTLSHCRTISSVFNLTRLSLLYGFVLTGFHLRIFNNLDLKRNLFRPCHTICWLSANTNDLLHSLLDCFNLRLTILDGHLENSVLTFLINNLFTRLEVLVIHNLRRVWNLKILRLHRRCRVVGAHANDPLGRFLGALSRRGRIAIQLTVLDLLS